MKSYLMLLSLCIFTIISCVNDPLPGATDPDLDPDVDPQHDTTFGYGQLVIKGQEAIGFRPMLVGLLHSNTSGVDWGAAANTGLLPNPQFFHNMMFDQSPYNKTVVNYFQSVSNGNLIITKAGNGVYGPYIHDEGTIPESGRFLVEQAGLEGLDFSQFDTNNDQVVDGGELLIFIIDNKTRRAGAKRTGSCVYPSNSKGVAVCADVAAGGSQASFTTYLHEISHLIGTTDLYGSNCHNQFLSLMSCTIYPFDHWMNTWYLDPWHRMVLGWTYFRSFDLPLYTLNNSNLANAKSNNAIMNNSHSDDDDGAHIFNRNENIQVPRVNDASVNLVLRELGVDIEATKNSLAGGCATLTAPQWHGIEPVKEKEPIILYSSALGTQSFIMLEYRNKNISPLDTVNFDADSSGQGLAIWQVQTTGTTTYPSVITGVSEGTLDRAVLTYGAPDGNRGGKNLWTAEHGEIPVRWINGIDMGLKIKVGAITSTTQEKVDVEWGMGGMPSASIQNVKIKNNQIVINGMLGLASRGRKVMLSQNNQSWELNIEGWSCNKVIAHLPTGLTKGLATIGIIATKDNVYEDYLDINM